jgi:predicted PurR-regulated permease PerM
LDVRRLQNDQRVRNGPRGERVRDERDDPNSRHDEQEPSRLHTIPWTLVARAATIGIFFLLFCVVLELARAVLLPVVSAIVIGLMLGPLSTLAGRYRIPSWVSATLLVASFVALVSLAITILSAPVVEWIGKAPEIGKIVSEKLRLLDRPLEALHDIRKALTPSDGGRTLQVEVGPSVVAPALTVLTPAIGELVVFVGTLFFFLLGREQLRRHLVQIFHARDARLRVLRIFNEVEQELTGYLSLVTIINVFVGVGAAIIAWFAGLPNIAVWAVLAFVLNYIPYIGPLIMNVVLFAVGVITFPSLGEALIAPAFFVTMTTLEGHFITPAIVGRRLTLNPLNVFLALVFWTWLWGPVGAFLAVPLLITVLVALRHLYPKSEVSLPE